MMSFKKLTVKAVVCTAGAALLVTGHPGYQAAAQDNSNGSVLAPAQGSNAQQTTTCDNPYIWAYIGLGRAEEYDLLTGNSTQRSIQSNYDGTVIFDEDRELGYVFGDDAVNVYNSGDLEGNAIAEVTLDANGDGNLMESAIVVDGNGDVIATARDGDDLKFYKLLDSQQLSEIEDYNDDELDSQELAVASGVGAGRSADWDAGSLAVLPQGLIALIGEWDKSDTDSYKSISLGFIPLNSDGTYGQLRELGHLEFEGKTWTPGRFGVNGVRQHIRAFYKSGLLFVVNVMGTLYTIDDDVLRSYLDNPDSARGIEIKKHGVQLNISRELRPYMEERIAKLPIDQQDDARRFYLDMIRKNAGSPVGYQLSSCDSDSVILSSTHDVSFTREVDSAGAPVEDKYTAQFTVDVENVTDTEAADYSVVYKPSFDANVFQIESVSWRETNDAFKGAITDAAALTPGRTLSRVSRSVSAADASTVATSVVTNGIEIDLIANSQGDATIPAKSTKSIEVTVKYAQIGKNPTCNPEDHVTISESCISNTVLIPGKTLSRVGRSVIDLPGFATPPANNVPNPADPTQPGQHGGAHDPNHADQMDPDNPATPVDPAVPADPADPGNSNVGGATDTDVPGGMNPVPLAPNDMMNSAKQPGAGAELAATGGGASSLALTGVGAAALFGAGLLLTRRRVRVNK